MRVKRLESGYAGTASGEVAPKRTRWLGAWGNWRRGWVWQPTLSRARVELWRVLRARCGQANDDRGAWGRMQIKYSSE